MSISTHQYDVAIIGYGPVGAMMGLLLREQGIRTVIIERDTTVSDFPRAAHLDDEVVRIYQAAGLLGLSETMDNPPRYTYYDKDWKPFLSRLFPQGISDQGLKHDFMFFQPDVEKAMRARLESGVNRPDVRLGTTVTNITQDGSGVTLETVNQNGDTDSLRAAWLIGCDGATSLVRKKMGSKFQQISESRQWYIVDIELLGEAADDPGNDQWEYCDPERIVTYIHLSGPYRRFEFDVKPGESEADLGTEERTWELMAPWYRPDEARIMRNDIYKFHSLLANTWRNDRILIAGDAAHCMSPKLGQGLCTGLRDTANLAWKLGRVISGDSDASLLDSYEAERKAPAREYIEISAYMVDQIISKAQYADDEGDQTSDQHAVEQLVAPRQRILTDEHREEDDLIGTLSRQPTLADGSLMDDSIGYRFCLIARSTALDDLSETDRNVLAALHAIVLRADDPSLATWLDEAQRDALLIRPDRYIAATAKVGASLSEMLAEVAHDLVA